MHYSEPHSMLIADHIEEFTPLTPRVIYVVGKGCLVSANEFEG